jgi:hypothetical protein
MVERRLSAGSVSGSGLLGAVDDRFLIHASMRILMAGSEARRGDLVVLCASSQPGVGDAAL